MPRHRINKNVLINHFKHQLTERLKTTPNTIVFRSSDPRLSINITIKGNRLIKKYNIIINASLYEGAEEWQTKTSDYWDKEKNMGPVRRAEGYIKHTKRIIGLGKEMVGYGSFSSEIEKIDRENVEEEKENLAKAEKMLAEAKKNSGISGTIKQMLSSIATEFSQYYRCAKQHERYYKHNTAQTEELRNQLGTTAETSTPLRDDFFFLLPGGQALSIPIK